MGVLGCGKMSEDGNESGERRGRAKPTAEMGLVKLLLSAAEDSDRPLGKVLAIHAAMNSSKYANLATKQKELMIQSLFASMRKTLAGNTEALKLIPLKAKRSYADCWDEFVAHSPSDFEGDDSDSSNSVSGSTGSRTSDDVGTDTDQLENKTDSEATTAALLHATQLENEALEADSKA